MTALLAAGSTQTVEVNGARLHVEVRGAGEAVLLLHGGAGSSAVWAPYADELAKRYRVVLPDARGHGRSTDGAQPLSYRLMADDFAAVLDQLGIGSASVVGWSDGGIEGLLLAIHHPSKVKRLVVLGANVRVDGVKRDFHGWLKTATPATFDPATRKGYEKVAPDPAHWPVFAQKLIDMWRREPSISDQELKGIRAPTLVAVGDRDLVRPEHAVAMYQAIPGSRLWILPNAVHTVVRDEPARVLPTVAAFLAE